MSVRKLALIVLLAVLPFAAQAQSKDDDSATLLKMGASTGPATISLRDQATLDLPKGYIFIPEKAAIEIMNSRGNKVGPEFAGIIIPENDGGWISTVSCSTSGYIKDDDAKNWNADDLLARIKETTDESNQTKREKGLPEVDVLGWIEKPHYDEATRRLIWSISVKVHGAGVPADTENYINYRTLQLGREGYISLVMATKASMIETQKPVAAMLLSKIAFKPGKRYADFNIATDKVAEYGLGALIVGVAAKKLGLIAIAVAFAAKFFKIIIVAVLAFFAAIRGKIRRKPAVPRIDPPSGPPGA